MNILVLNGSPKGNASNTLRLTHSFLEGLQDTFSNKNIETFIDIVHINNLHIEACRGCFSCWNKTPGRCMINDDMVSVLEKLRWADLIIWSFPLYYFNVPGPLKTLIDRQLPLSLPFMTERTDGAGNGNHPSRYDMSGKRTILISTCGFYTAERNYDSVTGLFDHICGKGNYTTLFCGQGELFRVPELSERTNAYLQVVYTAGKEYATSTIQPDTIQALSQPLYAKDVFERMADASWGIDKTTGVKEEPALTFTKQMAALYQPTAYNNKEIILEMFYTDIQKHYQLILGPEKATVITKDFRPYTTCIETTYSLWQDIATGKTRGDSALMEGKYRVLGDINLIIHWDDYFGNSTDALVINQSNNPNYPDRATTMVSLLLPWMCLWIGTAINDFWGSLVSVGICSLLPLIFYRHKRTIYDALSIAGVSLCAIGILVKISSTVIIPLSYLLCGTMWTVSIFQSIPLTAYYSMNKYNGESALQNPIFIKTNRILTATWGVLFLLTPIWTIACIHRDMILTLTVINSLLPIMLGLFTLWFQHWYPAKIISGK